MFRRFFRRLRSANRRQDQRIVRRIMRRRRMRFSRRIDPSTACASATTQKISRDKRVTETPTETGMPTTTTANSLVAPTLEVPAGTLASRIEALADRDGGEAPSPSWRVLDVRSTFFGPNGEELRLLRLREGGGLTGLAWPRSNEGARQAAAQLVSSLLR